LGAGVAGPGGRGDAVSGVEPTDPATPGVPARRGWLDRLLLPFGDVRAGEGADVLLLTLGVFLLLLAYYVIKVVRETLILSEGGAELKSYISAGQALLLLFLVPAYSRFASRVNRERLMLGVTLFFVANLVVFIVLATARTPGLHVAFFLWVGIFNLMVIAQFWSFANDVYTNEQGKRLFGIVGFGQTIGAILGGVVAHVLLGSLGVNALMLLAAAVLLLYALVTFGVGRRRNRSAVAVGAPTGDPGALDRRGGFELVRRDRYLLLIGVLLLLLNFVNTNGEYLLGRIVSGEANRLVAEGAAGALGAEAFRKQFIGGFYSEYFTWVNTLSALVQLFLVSRIMQRFGVRVALWVLPVVAFGGYASLAFLPLLPLVRLAKIGENSLDYSLNNTARQALFLPTSRDVKYKGKQAVDTLFVRAGDLLSAGLVFTGSVLSLTLQAFAIVNVGLILLWLGVVAALVRRHGMLVDAAEAEQARVADALTSGPLPSVPPGAAPAPGATDG